ncbi:hypothetical protein BR93DRAFT_525908 [Coniochaeta sp. PMI_546]|nr:hypothetical protein BR93DRAFT_525908 [Coniochaeta sp. PMI_546]
MAIIRYTRYLLGVLAIVTLVAAAPSPTKTIGLFDQPPHTSPTCVIGVPAVQPSDGSFPITYYAIVAPTAAAGDAIAAHYKLNSTWSKAHRLDGNHFNSSGVGPYEAMKCQYNCNARDNCVSFFVSDIDGPCALFDALIEPTLFVLDEDSNPHGAYDLLCNPPPNPFNGGKRDGVFYQPVRREEKVIGNFATNMVLDDNCTETHVSPSEDWVNYAPNQDFVTKHGHYTVSWTSKSPSRPSVSAFTEMKYGLLLQ